MDDSMFRVIVAASAVVIAICQIVIALPRVQRP